MRTRLFESLLAIAAAAAPASASAMSAPSQDVHGPCRVIGGEKLPAATGGPTEVCAAFARAIAAHAPKLRYTAEVRVLSKSGLAVKVVANGRTVADQRFSIMDKDLNAASIQRFAETIAAQVAGITKL
jgi:hypothetical protein